MKSVRIQGRWKPWIQEFSYNDSESSADSQSSIYDNLWWSMPHPEALSLMHHSSQESPTRGRSAAMSNTLHTSYQHWLCFRSVAMHLFLAELPPTVSTFPLPCLQAFAGFDLKQNQSWDQYISPLFPKVLGAEGATYPCVGHQPVPGCEMRLVLSPWIKMIKHLTLRLNCKIGEHTFVRYPCLRSWLKRQIPVESLRFPKFPCWGRFFSSGMVQAHDPEPKWAKARAFHNLPLTLARSNKIHLAYLQVSHTQR
jgi:hypothetical protein